MSDHQLATKINFWGETSEEDFFNLKGIIGSKSFFTSPRGINLFTRSWLPSSSSSSPPRGLIFMVHGYGNDVSWTFQSTPIFLAQMGFACFALDIEGHGRSDGVRAYVPSVDLVVDDLISFFNSIKQNPKFQGLPRFLFGESMGGAICLLIHFADPLGFDGAVLVAPMCRISDKVRPKWPIDKFLITISRFVPTWAIVPTEDLLEKSIKVEEKKPIARRNPMRYSEKPRLGTVMELLRVTDYLGKKLKDVSFPFIVLHGSADAVTDPEVSRELYENAKSKDKTLKIYEGMMHSMLFGEPDENIEIVRKDIVCWLNDRCGGGDQTQLYFLINKTAESRDLASITDRLAVIKAMECGNLEVATEKLNALDPEILESNFNRNQQRAIELIREERGEEAFHYSKDELIPLVGENKALLEELEKTVTLLAYDYPSTCPLKDLIDTSRRFKRASEVNAAIRTSQTCEKKVPNLNAW